MLSVAENRTLDVSASCKNDVSIQCELLPAKLEPWHNFVIKDQHERSRFLTLIYGILILQQVLCLIAMIIFRSYSTAYISVWTYELYTLCLLVVFVAFYLTSEKRRAGFLKYIGFIIVTLIYICWEVLYAKLVSSNWVLLQPAFMISQFIALLIFSRLHCIVKRNYMCFSLIFFLSMIYVVARIFWTSENLFFFHLRAVVLAGYMLYSVEHILHGKRLRYRLIESHEYIFAVTNLYAEYPVFFWHLFCLFFVDILSIYKFFKKCCKREFC